MKFQPLLSFLIHVVDPKLFSSDPYGSECWRLEWERRAVSQVPVDSWGEGAGPRDSRAGRAQAPHASHLLLIVFLLMLSLLILPLVSPNWTVFDIMCFFSSVFLVQHMHYNYVYNAECFFNKWALAIFFPWSPPFSTQSANFILSSYALHTRLNYTSVIAQMYLRYCTSAVHI